MRLLQCTKSFWLGKKGREGNVAIIFALALVPMIGAVGAALDYSMASANRASMQKALDATALQLAKMMPLTQQELNTKGWQIFNANVGRVAVVINQGDLTILTPSTGKIELDIIGQYQPQIAPVIGISRFPVRAHSEVTWGIKRLELALALDNTGSMGDNNKMTELKKAAKNLVATLKASATKVGDVKISIIPFNTMVNTGQTTTTAWIKKGDWDLKEGSCSKRDYWGNPYPTKALCQTYSGTWTPLTYNNTNFKGCVEDRDKDTNLNYDALDLTPTTSTATKFPARRCAGGLTTYLPLTYDWTALNSKIDAMDSVGATNVTIGLAWAWHSLTASVPLTEAAAPATDLSKFIILMTDGENTENRFSTSQSAIDLRTALACVNVKAAGIKIYSIRVIDGNTTLLKNCASDPSMFFDVKSASELTSVFNAIGGQLASLHLSE